MRLIHNALFGSRCRAVTPERAALGLAAGAATGTALTVAATTVGFNWPIALLGLPALFAIQFIVWGPCVLLLGGGPWWVLHRAGVRGWLAAALLGAAAPPFGLLAGGYRDLPVIGGFSAAGALAGLVFWLIAYGKRAGDATLP